jgi:predicted DNA-binding transcriptional regulator AlpA
MARNKQLTLDQAKALADKWHDMGEGLREAQSLRSRFSAAGPHNVIAMWESGRVIEDPKSPRSRNGKPLTKFEVQALGERWAELFNCHPPELGSGTVPAAPSAPAAPMPSVGPRLRMRDVVRETTLSPSTIKRKVIDKTFPAPIKVSTRRIAWDAGKVRDWIAKQEDGS